MRIVFFPRCNHQWSQWVTSGRPALTPLLSGARKPEPVQRMKLTTNTQEYTPQHIEVGIAKSIDELMTSRSITGRRVFSDYDMLDAMIASALRRRLNKHIHFRKRVCVGEQHAQKHDRLLRGRQIVHMIYQHFRATGACEAVQGL